MNRLGFLKRCQKTEFGQEFKLQLPDSFARAGPIKCGLRVPGKPPANRVGMRSHALRASPRLVCKQRRLRKSYSLPSDVQQFPPETSLLRTRVPARCKTELRSPEFLALSACPVEPGSGFPQKFEKYEKPTVIVLESHIKGNFMGYAAISLNKENYRPP